MVFLLVHPDSFIEFGLELVQDCIGLPLTQLNRVRDLSPFRTSTKDSNSLTASSSITSWSKYFGSCFTLSISAVSGDIMSKMSKAPNSWFYPSNMYAINFELDGFFLVRVNPASFLEAKYWSLL